MNTSHRLKNFAILGILVFLVSSCLKNTDEENRKRENKLITDYIDQNYPGAQPTSTGLYVVDTIAGNGAMPTISDVVIFEYTGKTLDGKIFDTSNQAVAKSNNLTSTLSVTDGPIKLTLGYFNVYGVKEGLLGMKEGGSATLIMPSLLAFNDYNPVIYQVKLLKVITDPAAFEFNQLTRYLADSLNLTPDDSTKTDITGIYMKADTSARVAGSLFPTAGNTITLNYTAQLIPYNDDHYLHVPIRTIQTGTGFKFVLGVDNVIQGFEGAIRLMKKGDKATVTFPYYRGYGSGPYTNNYNQLVIPEYSTLIYKIEVTDVQ